MRSQSSLSSSTPMWRAIAFEVDRRVRRAADRGADDDRVLERGARQHVRRASGPRAPSRRCAARSVRHLLRGRGAAPGWPRSRAGSCRAPRRASSSSIAVPIVLQCPADGADEATSSTNFRRVDLAAREQLARLPDDRPRARALPLNQPFSIGPPDSTIAGMSTVAAAISCAGVVLSQPVVSTTPSSG